MKRNSTLHSQLFTLILIFTLLACCFSACGEQTIIRPGEPVSRTDETANISLTLNLGCSRDYSLPSPYDSDSDLDKSLVSLMYEPLYRLDDEFRAVPVLAKEISEPDAEGSMNVVVDTDRQFSDGTYITAVDVVYSFRQAKNSSEYSAELSAFRSAEAKSLDTVLFSLNSYRVGAADALNFPVVQNATADDENDLPIGTGMYAKMTHGASILSLNPYYPGEKPYIKAINLVPVSDDASLVQTLDTGLIDAYFDDFSAGTVIETAGRTVFTPMPNLVYLGLNSEAYGLSDPAVRQAIGYSVNRRAIAMNAYEGTAKEAYTPFHPGWYRLKESGFDTSSLVLDFSRAARLMYGADIDSDYSCRLLVYSGNGFKTAAARQIADDLAHIGIDVIVDEREWSEYTEALGKGDYELYIGEVVTPACMDISPLLRGYHSLYGISDADTTDTAFAQFSRGSIDMSAFMDSFTGNSPFVPLVYRDGALYCSRSIAPAVDTDWHMPFKNIVEWHFVEPEYVSKEPETFY
ncbi:MAG: hypothetical protein K6G90_07195 [Clostridia bacterium]|nr:hypothetical protein [Clostridia bacterium]